jgi:hypothetical protein
MGLHNGPRAGGVAEWHEEPCARRASESATWQWTEGQGRGGVGAIRFSSERGAGGKGSIGGPGLVRQWGGGEARTEERREDGGSGGARGGAAGGAAESEDGCVGQKKNGRRGAWAGKKNQSVSRRADTGA